MNSFLNEIVSNEFLAHQRGYKLKNAMVEILTPFMGVKGTTVESLNTTPMVKVIKQYTGLSIKFSHDEDAYDNAYVITPDLKIDNIFVRIQHIPEGETFNETFHIAKKRNMELTGSVNLKTSKVSGLFSNITCIVSVGSNLITSNKFTAEEIISLLLHELGHAFCYFFYLTDVTRTNIVLSVLNRSNYFNSANDKKIKILDKIEEDIGFIIPDKEQMTLLDENKTYMVIVADSLRNNRSELNTPTYDQRTFEFLADQFAIMHGAGSSLATILSKLDRKYMDLVDKDYHNCIRKIISHVIFFFKYIGLGPISLIFWSWLLMDYEEIKNRPDLYDTPLIRFNKMREQMIGQLKDRKLTKNEKNEIIVNINAIETLIKTSEENRGGLDLAFLKAVMPWFRRKKSIAQLQHDYESLVYNPFYKQSAQLS